MATNLPQVGLEAIIAGLPGFESGAKAINAAYDAIEKKAGNVEKASKNLSSTLSSLSSPFVNLGQSILKVGAIAGGAALVGLGALTAGVVALGSTALQETAKYERMSLSINNLVAREISQGQVVEQQRQVLASLTKKETEELQKLQEGLDNEANQRDVLSARIQEQKERIRQLTDQYGDQGLVVIKERAELQGMELDFQDLNKEISDHQSRITELTGKQGEYVTVIDKVRVGQMSMTDAMAQAAPRAQELLKWIQILAIQSPFTQEGIAEAFRTTLAYGFTTEAAQRLTTAMVDFTSATGKSEQSAQLIALALGQIQARGKLSAQELRQLSEQGVGVNAILERMGFTLDDVTNGLVGTDEFIEAVVQDMEIFKGSAKAQSTTLAGLMASMSDLKSIGLREFFTGTFKAIQPYATKFVNFLTQAALETGSIKALGDALGNYVGKVIKNISTFIATIQSGGLAFFSKYLGAEGIPLWYELAELVGNISGSLSNLGTLFSDNLGGPLTDFTTNIIPMLTQGIAFINEHFVEFQGALLGIGAVMGVGVFAAVVAGVLSLLTPINLIIAGAALLGAAWAGNWGDIQGKVFAAWAVIQPILSQIVSTISSLINIFNVFGANAAFAVFGQMIVNWLNQINPNLGIMATWLQTNLPVAIQFLSDTWTNILQPALMTVGTFITGTVIPLLSELWGWLNENIPVALQYLSDVWSTVLLPAITAVWGFISTSLFPLWVSIITFFNAVAFKAVQALAGLWQNVLQPALASVWKLIQDNVMPIFVSLIEKIGGEGGLGPMIKSFSDNVLPAFKKGMEGITDILKKATDFFNSLASSVKNFQLPAVLQPGSPTPFENALLGIANAANMAGQAISGIITQQALDKILGLNRNIASNANIVEQARKSLARFYEAANLESGKRSLATRQLTALFQANQQVIMAAKDQVGKFKELAKQSGVLGQGAGFSGVQGAIAQKGFQAFIEGFLKAQTRLKLAQQEAFVEAGRTALTIGNKLNDVVEASSEILDERVKTLQELVDSGLTEVNYEGQIISAVRAQELLNQALLEQRDIQDDILQLRQNEQKLNFLEKQLDLIEQVTDAGLDVKQILGGITLGLDASIPDMIAATNKLVMAMIEQVNKDLQIGSPSRVMFDAMKQVGQGMVGGLLSVIPNVQGAMSQVVNGIINVPAGQVGGNNYSTTTNNNFNLAVSTLDSAPAVMGQFQTMRAMV